MYLVTIWLSFFFLVFFFFFNSQIHFPPFQASSHYFSLLARQMEMNQSGQYKKSINDCLQLFSFHRYWIKSLIFWCVCVHMVQCIVFLLIRWRLNIIDLGRVHCTLNSIDDIGQIFVHSIRCLFFSSLFHLDVIHFTPSRRRS